MSRKRSDAFETFLMKSISVRITNVFLFRGFEEKDYTYQASCIPNLLYSEFRLHLHSFLYSLFRISGIRITSYWEFVYLFSLSVKKEYTALVNTEIRQPNNLWYNLFIRACKTLLWTSFVPALLRSGTNWLCPNPRWSHWSRRCTSGIRLKCPW